MRPMMMLTMTMMMPPTTTRGLVRERARER
jgi:hypothetical protein